MLKVWNEPASLRAAAQFEQMLQSRQTGKPLQYILGSWGFRSLDLYLDERVLIPRPETEHLVEVASQELSRRRDSRFGQIGFDGDGSRSDESHSGESPRRLRVADMGCGSGAIGLSIAAEHTDVEVFCCDLSSDALAVTRANLAGLGMAASPVYIAQGHWYQGLKQATLLAAASSTHKFDLICSNPLILPTRKFCQPAFATLNRLKPCMQAKKAPRQLPNCSKVLPAGCWTEGLSFVR